MLPAQTLLWWPLVGAGLVLVLLSFVPRLVEARAAFGERTVRYGLNTAVMVLLVLGVIGFVEALSYRHNARIDLTENRRHSLSAQTVQLLGELPTDVQAVAFFRGDQPGKRVAEDLLEQYERAGGGRFTWKIVDPELAWGTLDLDLAMRAAEKAVAFTMEKDPAILDTLARVHFLKGDVKKAIEHQTKAVDVATGAMKESLQKALDEYKAKAAQ